MSINKLVGDIEYSRNGKIIEGSGFLVGPNDLLTAAHVVHNGNKFLSGGPITVYFDGRKYSAKVVWKTVSGAYDGSGDWKDDMALLTLDKPIGYQLGWMGMSSQSNHRTSNINLAGYSITENSSVYDGDNLQTDFVSATYNTLSGTISYTSYDIHGGSSGGPAYWYSSSSGDRYAVGIHVAGNKTINTGTVANLLTTSDINTLKKWIKSNGDSKKATINGTDGNDTLLGSNNSDKLIGKSGNDRLRAIDGNDTLEGGKHKDILEGGNGKDRLKGGSGNDTLDGGSGSDIAIFGNKFKKYVIVKKGANKYKVIDKSGNTGTDIVKNVEFFKFGNKKIDVKKDLKGHDAPMLNLDDDLIKAIDDQPSTLTVDDLLV